MEKHKAIKEKEQEKWMEAEIIYFKSIFERWRNSDLLGFVMECVRSSRVHFNELIYEDLC